MPLLYSGAPDIVEQLVQIYRGSVSSDIASDNRDLDEAYALAEMMAVAEGQAMSWARDTRLSTSQGIWTNQHARDRGLSRQGGEDDDTLIARLRTSPQAITEAALREAIAAVIAATGATGSAAVFYLVAVPVTHGAFCTTDMWCSADSRYTPTSVRMTIAIVPAALNIKAGVLDAMRSKMPAGHVARVEEY